MKASTSPYIKVSVHEALRLEYSQFIRKEKNHGVCRVLVKF